MRPNSTGSWFRVIVLLTALRAGAAHAQTGGPLGLQQRLSGLGASARVLVIGTHPDDDDGGLVASLSIGHGLSTGLLYVTRGEGTPNFIGPEGGETLGALRTAEALEARREDGARLFFTRAIDFGQTRNFKEAERRWMGQIGVDALMGDIVAVVRAFRPHVIVVLHRDDASEADGQHRATARLVGGLAGNWTDEARFPARIFGPPWEPLSTFVMASPGAIVAPQIGAVRVRTAEYSPELGRTYREVSAASRARLRSYGAVAPPAIGAGNVTLLPVAGVAAARRGGLLFEGVDTSFARFSDRAREMGAARVLDSLTEFIRSARTALSGQGPSATVAPLAALVRLVVTLSDRVANQSTTAIGDADFAASVAEITRRAEGALVIASGAAMEATAARETVARATDSDSTDALEISVRVQNRAAARLRLARVRVGSDSSSEIADQGELARDSVWSRVMRVRPRHTTEVWWRAAGRIGDTYALTPDGRDEATRQQSSAAGAVSVEVELDIAGARVRTSVPVVFRGEEPSRIAERVVAVVPGMALRVERPILYVRAGRPLQRVVRVGVQSSYGSARHATVSLRLPPGVRTDSLSRDITVPGDGLAFVDFTLRGAVKPGSLSLSVEARVGEDRYVMGASTVAYEHVASQRLYSPIFLRMISVNVETRGEPFVGYVTGASDFAPIALQDLDVSLVMLDPATLLRRDAVLSRYSAILIGPRAYELQPALVGATAQLKRYAQAGGVVVVLQGRGEVAAPGVLPFRVDIPLPARNAVGDDVRMNWLHPTHPALTRPNALGESDLEGWSRDKAAYLASDFDMAWQPLLELRDSGPEANRGALLLADVGLGRYVYTSLSLSRQLASGNQGAARLLVNLLTPGERAARR